MSFFAPPELFAAMAIATRSDPDLPDGANLRLLPSSVLGFPIAPFGIFRISATTVDVRPSPLLWRDARGNSYSGGTLDSAGGEITIDLQPPLDNAVDVAAEVTFAGGAATATVSLVDRVRVHLFSNTKVDRVLAERRTPPYIVGGPRLHRLRIKGRGPAPQVRVWRVFENSTKEAVRSIELLSLPIDQPQPWYTKGLGANVAMNRVKIGAPHRYGPPDRPNGQFDSLVPADQLEANRISSFAIAIGADCDQMLRDPKIRPHDQNVQRETTLQRRHVSDVGIQDSLLLQAMDPGVGRYLGLVSLPESDVVPGEQVVYMAVGLFACSLSDSLTDGRLLSTMLPTTVPPVIVNRLTSLIDPTGGELARVRKTINLYNAANQFSLSSVALPVIVRGVVTVAAAVPAPERPTLLSVDLAESRWLPDPTGKSKAFRQDFTIPATTTSVLLSIGRQDAGQGPWRSRHEPFRSNASVPASARAIANLMGQTRGGWLFRRKGYVSDTAIPALTGIATHRYRFAAADLFGRYGPFTEIAVPTPPRPAPPPPAPQVRVIADGPEDDSSGNASPGHIVVDVPVPSIFDLQLGSSDITAVEIWLDGTRTSNQPYPVPAETLPVDPHAPRKLRVVTSGPIPLPALGVGKTSHSTVTAQFTDKMGLKSSLIGTVTVPNADRRRPKTVPKTPGILWTSRSGPSPEVELKLKWQGNAGVQYRVYIGDAATLITDEAVSQLPENVRLLLRSRTNIATVGYELAKIQKLGARERFRLLTEPPLKLGPDPNDQYVYLNERLPRSLTTVQFLKVVPLTEQGREAEFDQCAVVAVAVPTDRRPPPPRVSATVSPTIGKATISIEALGFDINALQAAEPDLLAHPPRFRVRRASGPIPDPLYARQVGDGVLVLTRDDQQKLHFKGQFEDSTPLLPFVRYSYWVEVQMPPEHRVPPGYTESPEPGGVQPMDAVQIADMPPPFSDYSPPVSAVHVPAQFPKLESPSVRLAPTASGKVRLQMKLSSTPAVAHGVTPGYALRIWEQWGKNGSITLVSDKSVVNGSSFFWPGAADHDKPTSSDPVVILHVAIIDPLGRSGPVIHLKA